MWRPSSRCSCRTPGKPSSSIWVLAALGLAVALAGGYFTFFLDRGPTPQEDLVAVFPLENRTGDSALDPLGKTAADRIAAGFGTVGPWRVLANNDVESVLEGAGEAASARNTSVELGANLAITGHLTEVGDTLAFWWELMDVSTGERFASFEVSGSRTFPTSLLEDLQQRATSAALLMTVVDLRALPRVPTYEAAQSYVRGISIYRTGDWAGSLPHFLESYEADTTFLHPLLSAALRAGSLAWLRWIWLGSATRRNRDRRRNGLSTGTGPVIRTVFRWTEQAFC